MDNLTIDEMNRVRRLMGYSYVMLAKASGVPLSTVQKVLGRQTPSPRQDTLRSIQNGLEKLVREDRENGNIIHESAEPYGTGCAEMPDAVWGHTQGRTMTGKDEKERKNILIFDGQAWDPETAYAAIFRQAADSIIVVDPVMSVRTLELIRAAKKDIPVILYTDNEGTEQKLTRQGMKNFLSVNKSMRLLIGTIDGKYKNRYIILDSGTPAEKVFLLSSSVSDPEEGPACIIELKDTQFLPAMLADLEKNSYLVLK